ncbi:hypothetical protein VEZ01S_09_00270 [Vibrio ezurae NBRC 102218]|uniref:Uncharacterized protein n=1 Tax=Vibrio ezurae NBRC 102218 TaxID=1219080 RepID=U3CDA2_9VIBR|nr:hypothetical protein VEZ01S_09_00270 [Vibrio ezurae NBRC 102218]
MKLAKRFMTGKNANITEEQRKESARTLPRFLLFLGALVGWCSMVVYLTLSV